MPASLFLASGTDSATLVPITAVRYCCSLAVAFFLISASSYAADVKTLEIGDPAPDFSLPGVDGKTYSLSDFEGSDILAVVFTCNHCPTAQAFEGRIKGMVEDYQDKSFSLVAISPNDPLALRPDEFGYSIVGDSFEEMKWHAENYGFNFPYLYDGETQGAALAYGAMATPHFFLFDRERTLRYVGRIDDSYDGKSIKKPDARNAIDALLDGRPVPVEKTRTFGCSTKWREKRAWREKAEAEWKEQEVTIAPIGLEGLRALVANKTDKIRLINLWASWCGPCVSEMSELVDLNMRYQRRGLELITVSVDAPGRKEAALKILKENHAALSKPIAESLKEEGRDTNNFIVSSSDQDALAEALDPEWQGPIPYSILVAPGGEIFYRHHGAIDPFDVKKAIIGKVGRFLPEDRR